MIRTIHPPFRKLSVAALVQPLWVALLVLPAVTACGQTGDLYLPEPKSATTQPPPPPQAHAGQPMAPSPTGAGLQVIDEAPAAGTDNPIQDTLDD